MADWYFDSVSGSEANAGTTSAAPKLLFATALTKLNGGDNVYLKCGSQFGSTSGTTTGLGTVTATAGKLSYYGDVENPNPPVLDGFIYDAPKAGGWTSLGDGRWTKTFTGINSGQTFARVFPGVAFGTSSWMPRPNGLKYVSTAAAVTDVGKFNVVSQVITLYTGSTRIDPSQYFNGLAISANGTANFILRVFGSNVLYQNLMFLGGGGSGILFQANATDMVNNRLEDIQVMANFATGIALVSNHATLGCYDTKIIRPYVDAITCEQENYGSSSKWGGHNAIQVRDNAKRTTIVDPIVKGQRHTGIDAWDSNGTGSVSGLNIYTTSTKYGLIDCRFIDYGRGLGFLNTGYHVSGLRIVGAPTYSQFAGVGTVTRCTFRGLRPAGTIPSDANIGTDGGISWYNSDVAGFGAVTQNLSVVDITISNCLIENAYGYAFSQQYSSTTTATMAANSVKIYNNTIIDLVNPAGKYLPNATAYTLWQQVPICHDAYSGGASPDQLYKNNLVILPSGQTNVISSKTSTPGVFTNYTINGMTGAVTNAQSTGILTSKLNIDYQPQTGSSVIGAGTFVGTRATLDGVIRPNPPSIGALEKRIPRSQRS